MRFTVAAVLTALAAAPGSAQTPYPSAPLNYLPNFYNRTSQPLSPYLNLARGGNPGVNYYYGVRPGTPAGGMTPFGTPAAGLFGPQAQFLPQATIPFDPAAAPVEPGGREVVLRPAGHPVIYGNTFNGHGGYPGVAGRGGPAVGSRPALGGLGATPRPGPRR